MDVKEFYLKSYVGKIRLLENDSVRVSLWNSKLTEIIATIPRKDFPTDKLEVGNVFRYYSNSTIEMIQKRDLSQKEIDRMYTQIQRQLP